MPTVPTMHTHMSAEKQIRVSEEVRDELHGMKGVGESYDDVLRELVHEHNRQALADRMSDTEEMDRDDLVALE
jgi:predicted CopG family antitoxin